MVLRIIAGALFLVGAAASSLYAQGYPARAVRLIMPFPPGGPIDILGRILGQKLAIQLGQPVVPENRGGAGGNVGTEYAAKMPPDGYTIVLVSPSLSISPSLYRKLNYDPVKDFAPIALVAQTPNVLLVHPAVPAKTLKELIQLAKAHPGKLNFGSGGAGTSNHLAVEMLKALAGVSMVHVPYRGSGEAMLSMIGGHLDVVVVSVPPAIPQIRAGKVRALAVLRPERVASLPEVPTAIEAGTADYVVLTSFGMLAPSGTPRDIVARLNAELVGIVAMADVRDKMQSAGLEPMSSSPEEYAEFIKREIVRWAKVIKDANVKVESGLR